MIIKFMRGKRSAEAFLNLGDGQVQQQLPSTYSYDPTSGFYYDSATGLYYDPKTQASVI